MVDFTIPEETKMVQQLVRDFIKDQFMPIAAELAWPVCGVVY